VLDLQIKAFIEDHSQSYLTKKMRNVVNQ